MRVPATQSHWYILGAGSIGCLWAAYLKDSGAEVSLLLKDASQLQKYHDAGGIVIHNQEQDRHYKLTAFIPGDDLPRLDCILVTTKAQQTQSAISNWHRCIADNAFVLLLQNGMPSLAELRKTLSCQRLVCGTTTDGANRQQPFRVNIAGSGNTRLGAIAPTKNNDIEVELAALRLAHPQLELSDDIVSDLWQKLVVSAVINPLTAIYSCRNGELLQADLSDARIPALCDEIACIASASGHPRSGEEIRQQVSSICQLTSGNTSSMLADVKAGRVTEIQHINGFLCEQAAKLAVAAPINSALVASVEALRTPAV